MDAALQGQQELEAARASLLSSSSAYLKNSPKLIEQVTSRLGEMRRPEFGHSDRFLSAAGDLDRELHTDNLLGGLMGQAGFLIAAMSTFAGNLMIRYFQRIDSLRFVPPASGDTAEALAAVQDFGRQLHDAVDRDGAILVAVGDLVCWQAADAFYGAADLFVARLAFLHDFILATNPPAQAVGERGRYRISSAADASAREAALTGITVALDHLLTEAPKHIPVVGIGVSILSIAIDTRKEIKSLDKRRALWQEIGDAVYRRNIAEMAVDGLDTVRDETEGIGRLTNYLSLLTDRILELSTPPKDAAAM